jgi:WD40 repeat protein
MCDIFISYSRKDKDFVKSLHTALIQNNRDTWVDWEDIPFTADWWQEIQAGIEAADTFLAVLSPASVGSEFCREEVEHAVNCQKRLVPVVHQDSFDEAKVHPEIAKRNWLFFRDTDDFESTFQQLLQTIDTDLDYVRQHTRLTMRASEWQRSQQDASFLLRGSALEAAERWLTQAIGKAPQPSTLQASYIHASRQAELCCHRCWFSALITALLIAVGLGILAFGQFRSAVRSKFQAERNHVLAISASSAAWFHSGEELEALLEGLRAKRQFDQIPPEFQDREVRDRVTAALQAAVYWVKERNRLQSHTQAAISVCVSPQGNLIATAGRDKTIKLWRSDGTLVRTVWAAHQDWIYNIRFSPDGQRLATVSRDQTAKLWRLNGTLLKTLVGHRSEVYGVGFSPDGQTIATTGKDKTVRLWRQDGTPLQVLVGHQEEVYSVNFSPDGQTLVTGGQDQTVKLWTIATATARDLGRHRRAIVEVDFSPDGRTIASASTDQTVKRWHLDGTPLKPLVGHTDGVLSVSFSPDGRRIATASADRTIRLWDHQGNAIAILRGHRDWGEQVRFSPDGRSLVSVSRDKTARIWQPDSAYLKTLIGDHPLPTVISFNPTGDLLAAGSRSEPGLSLWRSDGTLYRSLSGHTNWVYHATFSPDGRLVASASADQTIKLWDVKTGKIVQQFDGPDRHQDWVTHVDFFRTAAQSPFLASTSADKTIKLWHLNGQLIRTLIGHQDWVLNVTYCPALQLIASAGRDQTVRLWHLNGTPLKVLHGHTAPIASVSFSPDCQLLASASLDKTVKLWKPDGTLFSTLRGHTDEIYRARFTQDGQRVITASNDRTLKIWQRDGTLLQTLHGHSDAVLNFKLVDHDRILVSASGDKTVIRWHLAENLDNLDQLAVRGCAWVRDYLNHNPTVKDRDRHLCDRQR